MSLLAFHTADNDSQEVDSLNQPKPKKDAKISDYLIGYSTTPGHVSYRNTQTGSYFISTLVKVFYANAHRMSITDMMTEINSEMSKARKKKIHKQQSDVHFVLEKHLYFYPGQGEKKDKTKRTKEGNYE